MVRNHQSMTTSRSLFAACVILLAANISRADTIYLKNGMYIVVTKATEKDGQIEYWVGSTKYTISKNMVTKIETGNGPSPTVRSAPPANRGTPGVRDLSRRESDSNSATSGHDKLKLPVPGETRQAGPYWAALRSRILQGRSGQRDQAGRD